MLTLVRRLLRHATYDLRGGFLVRPLAIALGLGALGVFLPLAEERWTALDRWAAQLPALVPHDPGTAQAMLGTIAAAVMTVISIVLSVLLLALTLASMQFSPRILTGFMDDRVSQHTIGLFLGTFLYCMAAYPAARSAPSIVVPSAAVLGAMVLVPLCVAWLLLFVQHISRSINVNHIADRVARETERIIDVELPTPLERRLRSEPPPRLPDLENGPALLASSSGYIRFIDTERLVTLAKRHGTIVRVERRVGQFVAQGTPLLRVATRRGFGEARAEELRGVFDLGSMRTLEQDIEFGVLQLVDIALKAISPAVNDPSTAISCIDQLSRLLVRVAGRSPAPSALYRPPGVLRVALSPLPFARLLDTAFGQIRYYGKTDLAVSLRLLRALGDVASATREPTYLAAIRSQAERVAAACCEHASPDEQLSVQARLAQVIRLTEEDASDRASPR